MAELLVVGSLLFWVVLAAEILLIFVLTEKEYGGYATLSLGVFLVGLHFLFKFDVLGFIGDHFTAILIGSVLYFIIGCVWATAKWWLYCKDRYNEYESHKIDWLKEKGVTNTKEVPDPLKAAWKEYLKKSAPGRYSSTAAAWAEVPSVRVNKARIMRWMSWWITSMLWSVIDDFVRRIFRAAYHWLADYLQGISNRIYAQFNRDTAEPESVKSE